MWFYRDFIVRRGRSQIDPQKGLILDQPLRLTETVSEKISCRIALQRRVLYILIVLATITSSAVFGIESYIVKVEVDVSSQLPYFATVGLPEAAVK